MKLLNEFLLKRTLALAEYIAHQEILKAGGKIENEAVNSVVMVVERDTKTILDRLASQEESKVISAYQYIQQAMSDLQVWSEQRIETVSNLYDPRSTSRYYERAIRQLEHADKWATVVLIDKHNSKHGRIEALNIRLFCRCVLDWDNKSLWFENWRKVLEPFFADRHFVKFVMGNQSWISKVSSDQNAKQLSERFVQLTTSLEALMWDIIMKDRSLISTAQEFAEYFDKYTTFSKDVRLQANWSGLNSLHSSDYRLTDNIVVKIHDTKFIFMMYEFRCMLHIGNGQIWALNHCDQLVVFDAETPTSRTLIGEKGKWARVWCARDLKEVYAICEQDNGRFIYVFHPKTRNIKSSLRIPNELDDQSDYNVSYDSSGVIQFSKQELRCTFEQSDDTSVCTRVDSSDMVEITIPGQWAGLVFKDMMFLIMVTGVY